MTDRGLLDKAKAAQKPSVNISFLSVAICGKFAFYSGITNRITLCKQTHTLYPGDDNDR